MSQMLEPKFQYPKSAIQDNPINICTDAEGVQRIKALLITYLFV